jgi:uncharacterized UPF0160 family protein
MSDYNCDTSVSRSIDDEILTGLGDTQDKTHLEETSEIANRTEISVSIQTHDKRFHVDDVGAIALLISYYNRKTENTNVHLIRSRDPELIKSSDILIDVGGIYDPSNKRFDHHQDNCNEFFGDNFNIPLSSIGMVWKHYGEEILHMYIQAHQEFSLISNWEDHITVLLNEIYGKIIQELDAHDNGIVSIEGGKRNYPTYLSLGNIISSMNTSDTNDEVKQMIAFQSAVQLFGTIFEIKLEEIIRKYFDYKVSYNIVEKVLKESPPNNEYLIIRDKLPTINKCLNVLDPKYHIKFLIFHSPLEEYVTIRTRNKKEDMFTSLVPLLSYDKTLEKIDDNEKADLIFVHKALFIAKTKTLDLALKLVGLALDSRPKVLSSSPQSYLNLPSFKSFDNNIYYAAGAIGLTSASLVGYYMFRSKLD